MQVKIDKVIGQLLLVDGLGEHNKEHWLLRLVQVLEKLVKGQIRWPLDLTLEKTDKE
jgi:hypothetical protein